MEIQVSKGSRPAPPRRTLLFSIGLFALSLILASSLSRHRRAELLGPRVGVQGWRFTFCPPKFFMAGDMIRTPEGDAMLWHGKRGPDDVVLAAWRLHGPFRGPDFGACEVLAEHFEAAGDPPLLGDTRGPVSLGGREACERLTASRATVVRAVVVGSDEAYALSLMLSAPEAALDDQAYALFSRVCDSAALPEP